MKFTDRFTERFRKRKEREQRESIVGPKGPEYLIPENKEPFLLGPATHHRGKDRPTRYYHPVTSRARRQRNRKRATMRSLVRRRLPHGRQVKPYRG